MALFLQHKAPENLDMMPQTLAHDALAKQFLADLNVAKALFQIYLPETIRSQCDFDTLKLEAGSYVEENLKQHYSDMLYSLQISGKRGYLYTMVEHISSPPQGCFPLYLLRCQLGVMQNHLNQRPQDKLPLVVTLVLYHGKASPYPYSRDLFEYFADPTLARQHVLKPFTLIDLTVIPDEEIMTHKSAALLELVQKNIFTRDLLEFLSPLVTLLNEQKPSRHLVKSMLNYIVQKGNTAHIEYILTVLKDQASDYRDEVMTIAEQLLQQGLQKGRQEGWQEGLQKGLQRGEAAILSCLLQQRFPNIPFSRYQSHLEQASPEVLLQWGRRLFTARRLEDIFIEAKED